MTGKITVGTIQDTDGNTVASTYVTRGVATAKLLFSQNDASAFTGGNNHSLNISSSSDHTTGVFGINFTSNMTNKAYPGSTAADGGGTTFGVNCIGYNDGGTYASDYRRSDGVLCGTRQLNDNSALDRTFNGVIIHGDLA